MTTTHDQLEDLDHIAGVKWAAYLHFPAWEALPTTAELSQLLTALNRYNRLANLEPGPLKDGDDAIHDLVRDFIIDCHANHHPEYADPFLDLGTAAIQRAAGLYDRRPAIAPFLYRDRLDTREPILTDDELATYTQSPTTHNYN